MFAPGYHYHMQFFKRAVSRPPSQEALTQLFWETVEGKSELLQFQLSVITTVLELPLAQLL